MNFDNFFCTRIKSLRLEYGFTQKQLAEHLNVTVTQISDIENGKTRTSLDRLILLSKFFNVSSDYLLGLSDNRYPDSKNLSSSQLQLLDAINKLSFEDTNALLDIAKRIQK